MLRGVIVVGDRIFSSFLGFSMLGVAKESRVGVFFRRGFWVVRGD